MTSNTGPRQKRKFRFSQRGGSSAKRKEFIDTEYIRGVKNEEGEMVIRPLNAKETEFLDKFYKEQYHAKFNTDEESREMFFKINRMLNKHKNFFEENGFYPVEVENAITDFDKKSKSLGNLIYRFWDQKEINSDDYKRLWDVHNKANREYKLDKLEDSEYNEDRYEREGSDTRIEDLITESED